MSQNYFVEINGKRVKVSEEVYLAYKRPIWTEQKRKKIRAEKERSLDFFDDGVEGLSSQERLVEEIVQDKLLLETLLQALETLSHDERSLINDLYYQEMSEQSVAKRLGVSKQAVNARKGRVLRKLADFFIKFEK